MEWGTLAVAAIGAIFGIAATSITDVLRSRREENHRWLEAKQASYARFVVSLTQTHSRMVTAAQDDPSLSGRRLTIYRSFSDDSNGADAKSTLRELGIIAPDHIFDEAEKVYIALRAIRELLTSEQVIVGSPEYGDAAGTFFRELKNLQRSMRDDLG